MNKISLFIILLAVFVFMFRVMAQADGPASEAWKKIGEGALVIDVRTPEEFSSGHLDDALNIVHDQTEALVQAIGGDKGRSVVLYCRTGRRSGLAKDALLGMGYTNVFNGGGFTALRDGR